MLTHKDEVFERFQEWKVLMENSSGHKLKVLRTDNGGEYTSNEFENYLKDQGIRHECKVPKAPEQNGVSERMNRTLAEVMRSRLQVSLLSQVRTYPTKLYRVSSKPKEVQQRPLMDRHHLKPGQVTSLT